MVELIVPRNYLGFYFLGYSVRRALTNNITIKTVVVFPIIHCTNPEYLFLVLIFKHSLNQITTVVWSLAAHGKMQSHKHTETG